MITTSPMYKDFPSLLFSPLPMVNCFHSLLDTDDEDDVYRIIIIPLLLLVMSGVTPLFRHSTNDSFQSVLCHIAKTVAYQ